MDLDELNKIAENKNKAPKKDKQISKTPTKKPTNDARVTNIDKSLDKIDKQIGVLQKSIKENKYKTGKNKIEEKKSQRNKTPEQKKSNNLANATISYKEEKSDKFNKISFEQLKNLNEEIDHIKEFCKNIKRSVDESCLLDNDKKAFNKMKNDFIKQSADINILKDDMQEMMRNMHFMVKRIETLEEENKNLRKHNQNLIRFVKNIGQGDNTIKTNINIIEVFII
jgi:chromosome segregation ATPase